MQRVHAATRVGTPLISRTAFWTFGRHIRFVLRFEWLTLWPNDTVLSQISQRPFTVSPPELSFSGTVTRCSSPRLGTDFQAVAPRLERPGNGASVSDPSS